MDMRRLRVFVAVAREGSISAAAAALGYAQPTVSHHLAALEAQLGTRLVERVPRGVVLNDRGLALMPHAEAVLSRLEQGERAVRDQAELRAGSLRIGTFATAGARLLPGPVADLHRRHPGLQVTLTQAEPADTVAALRDGRLDLALVFSQRGHVTERATDVAFHHLLDDPLFLVLPEGHPQARRARVPLTALAGDRWITGVLPEDPCSMLLIQACLRAGFTPQILLNSDDYAVVRAFVAAGMGVALVPQLALLQVPEPVVVREVAGPPIVRQVHVAVPASGATAAAQALLAMLRDTVCDATSASVRSA
jgi:DNA-binding transcriptional LysR family regulator